MSPLRLAPALLLFTVLATARPAAAQELPTEAQVRVTKAGFVLFLYWANDPGFPSGMAAEFEVHIDRKCFAAPFDGKDATPDLQGVDTNLPGGFPNVYRDVWNWYEPGSPQEAASDVLFGCGDPILAAGAVANFDAIADVADSIGNFAVGIKDASLLEAGVYYYILYEFGDAISTDECSSSPVGSRARVHMQAFANTCTLSQWDQPITTSTCPMVLGFDQCGEYAEFGKPSYSLHEQLCAPTALYPFLPGEHVSSAGACVDADNDHWFRSLAPNQSLVPMYGTLVGDCDDTNPNVNPSEGNCYCAGQVPGYYCLSTLLNDPTAPEDLVYCSDGVGSPPVGCAIECLENPPGVNDTCCGDGLCDASALEDCSRCSADCSCGGSTCSDGIQNQGEAGVDCGGPCAPCASCASGAVERCWVECIQNYASGCIHGGIPPLIPGLRTCGGGQWSACAVNEACSNLDDACVNGSELAATYSCVDGSTRTGAFHCFLPLGAGCSTSYYGNWPVDDCPADLCLGAGDGCSADGQTRACEVHCDSPQGPTRQGTQSCVSYCGGNLAWGPCITNDGCLQ